MKLISKSQFLDYLVCPKDASDFTDKQQNQIVDVPTNVATDTPVSVISAPAETPTDNASSTPVSEPVEVPAPVGGEAVPVAVAETPVVAPPVVESAPPVAQAASAPGATDKYGQSLSWLRQLLEKAHAARKQRQVSNLAKLYQYILKRKRTTVRDTQIYLFCRRSAAENYLNFLIKQNQIKRVGNIGSNSTYYVSV